MKIAFLHALPFDERMWEPQLPTLRPEVHAPTLYALGASFDEWALGRAPAGARARFVAVGASMGGYTAAAIARLAPERLEGLVLVGSRADADPPERAPLREEWIRIAREQGGEGLWEAAAKNFFAPGTTREIVERAHRIAAEQDPEGLVRAIVAIRDRPDSTEAVTSGIPLLVVAGEQDPLIPVAVAEELAAALAERPRRGARAAATCRTGSGRTSSTGSCRPSSRRCERASAGRRRGLGGRAPGRGGAAARRRPRAERAHPRAPARLDPARARLAGAGHRPRACSRRLAAEVGLRLRRHGVTGEERLVLYDGGDCIGACSSAQLAELAGHPAVVDHGGRLEVVDRRSGGGSGGAGQEPERARPALRGGADGRGARAVASTTRS